MAKNLGGGNFIRLTVVKKSHVYEHHARFSCTKTKRQFCVIFQRHNNGKPTLRFITDEKKYNRTASSDEAMNFPPLKEEEKADMYEF